MPTRTLTDFIPPLRYFTFVCSAISLFIVLYLLWELKKLYAKLLQDVHYQIRLVLVLVLLINKIWQFLYLVADAQSRLSNEVYNDSMRNYERNRTAENWFIVERDSLPYQRDYFTSQIHYFVLYTTFCLVFYLAFLLAMDRYERITSHALWAKKRRVLLLLLRILILLGYIMVMILYGLRYVTYLLVEYGDYMRRIYIWGEYRNIVAVPVISTTLFIYYTLTIRMVYFCILVNKEHRKILFQKFGLIWWQWMKHLFKTPSTVSHTTPSASTDVISPMRLVLAVKMITYFILLFLTDCIIIGILVWMSVFSSELFYFFDDLFSLGQFWISLHAIFAFRLFDLMVQDLIAPWSLPGFTSNGEDTLQL